MHDKHIKLSAIGNINMLPNDVKQQLSEVMVSQFNNCMNYSKGEMFTLVLFNEQFDLLRQFFLSAFNDFSHLRHKIQIYSKSHQDGNLHKKK